MANPITIDLFPADNVPLPTTVLHEKTALGVDQKLPLNNLYDFIFGNSAGHVINQDYHTILTGGPFWNTSTVNSPDGTTGPFLIQCFHNPTAGNVMAVTHTATSSSGQVYFEYLDNS